MQPSPGHKAPGQTGEASSEFLIPDLGSPRAVLVMVLLAELMVLIYTLARSELPRFQWDLLASCSLFVQWVVLASAALLSPLRKVFNGLSIRMAAINSLLLVMAVTGISSVLVMRLNPQLPAGIDGLWWLLRNELVALGLAGIALRYFYLQQQLRAREKSELQARLDSLKARIRPHFLFNTMNSIASLIATNPVLAEQAVENLSELFRANLQENSQPTTIADELRLCELYLNIEQLRLGDRLTVKWQVEPGLSEVPCPGLLLQPLLENAVYHGIAPLPGGGTISVQLLRRGTSIQVEIENPTSEHPGHTGGNQMALVNIEQRLQGLYGSGAGVQIFRAPKCYRVQLHFPVEGQR